MKIICPGCGHDFDFEEVLRDTANDQILRLYIRFGDHLRLAFSYVRCFRRHPSVPLQEGRHLRLLEELWEMVRTGVFDSGGKKYAVKGQKVIEGMKAVCEQELKGLKNHNYLKTILVKNS